MRINICSFFCFLFFLFCLPGHSVHEEDIDTKFFSLIKIILVDATPGKITLRQEKNLRTLLNSIPSELKDNNLQAYTKMARNHAAHYILENADIDYKKIQENYYAFSVNKKFGKQNLKPIWDYVEFFVGLLKQFILVEEKFSHVPLDYTLKPFKSIEELLDQMSVKFQGRILFDGLRLVSNFPGKRFDEFLRDAQQAIIPPTVDIKTIKYQNAEYGDLAFTLPAWRILHHGGFFKIEGKDFFDGEGKEAIKEIVDFASASLPNLQKYLKFAQEKSFSQPSDFCKGHTYTVINLRRKIFESWLSTNERATLFTTLHKRIVSYEFKELDAWLIADIKLPAILDELVPGTKNENRKYIKQLMNKHAPFFKESPEKFITFSHYYSTAAKQSTSEKFYTNLRQEIALKAGIPDRPRPFIFYFFDDFTEQQKFLENVSLDAMWENGVINGTPFLENFFTSSSEMSNSLLSNLLLVQKPSAYANIQGRESLKMGYFTYKGLPLAAWRFIHGQPYQIENISWQEIKNIVLDYYSSSEKFLEFLRFFEDKVKPTLKNTLCAKRLIDTRRELIIQQAEQFPDSYLIAKKEGLIEKDLADTIHVTVEENVAPQEQSILVASLPEMIIDEEVSSSGLIVDDTFIRNDTARDLSLESASLFNDLNAIKNWPFSSFQWREHFVQFMQHYVPKESLDQFLRDYDDCAALQDTVDKSALQCQELFDARHPLFSKVEMQKRYDHEISQYDYVALTLQKMIVKHPISFSPNPCLLHAQNHIKLLQTIERDGVLNEMSFALYSDSKEKIKESFSYLLSWITIQKSELQAKRAFFDAALDQLRKGAKILANASGADVNPSFSVNRQQVSPYADMWIDFLQLQKHHVTSSKWRGHFIKLVKNFIPDEKLHEFLMHWKECRDLYLSANEQALIAQQFFNGRAYYIDELNKSMRPKEITQKFGHAISQYDYIASTIEKMHVRDPLSCLINPWFLLCPQQIKLHRKLQQNEPLDDNEQFSLNANQQRLNESFDFLLAWVIMQKNYLSARVNFYQLSLAKMDGFEQDFLKHINSQKPKQVTKHGAGAF